ncbi:50S ribosomal protein L11 [archaeon]|nr:50S ribosomal protein L11 [archaeon]MBT6823868.1 50S ribosomal protein L11 [archaeon]MBT7107399.1 50S ribosomal protein L11 [archaeon]MBT7297207.1 50S ribosomal protein L11 [archaeon]
MAKEIVDIIIEGGKASPGPQMGQAFGPLGVNIQDILGEINKRTADFAGMKVPVSVSVDTSTKEFELEVGTPPVSELIKKELVIQKGSGESHINKVGNLAIEQAIKISRMKKDSLIVNTLKAGVKSVVGSCITMGVLVEGKSPRDVEQEIDQGVYDNEINSEKTDLSDEKRAKLKSQLDTIKSELEKSQAALEKASEGEEGKEESGEEGKPEEKKEEPVEKK